MRAQVHSTVYSPLARTDALNRLQRPHLYLSTQLLPKLLTPNSRGTR